MASAVQTAASGATPAPAATGNAEAKERRPRSNRAPLQVEKVDQPNESDFKAATVKLQADISALDKRITALSAQVDKQSVERQQYREQKKAVIAKLKDLKTQRDQLFAARNTLSADITKKDEEKKTRIANVNNYRKNLKFFTVEEIDQAIAAIEYRLSTTTVSLKVEKDMINEIKNLRSSKDEVKRYEDAKKNVDDAALDTRQLRAERDQRSKELNSLRDIEQQHSSALKDIKDKENAVNDSIVAAISQRQAAYDEKRKLSDELFQLKKRFETQKRQFELWIKHKDYLRQQKEREERRARAIEREQRRVEYEALREPEIPWQLETYRCEELIRYLERLAPQTAVPAADEKSADEQKAESDRERNAGFKGKSAVPLQKKAEDSLSVLFGASAPGAKKSEPKKKAAPMKKLTAIPHIPDVFEQFESLGLKPPLTVEAIPASLKELEDKLQYFKTAPAPPTKAEKDALAKKAEKERQERGLNADIRAQEAVTRAATGKDVVSAERQEQSARVQDVQAAVQESQQERAAAGKKAKAAVAEEQARQVADQEEAVEQSRIASAHSRKASSTLASVEQARQVAELDAERKAASQETKAAQDEARKRAADAFKVEQQRAVSEHDSLEALVHEEEARLQKEARDLANRLEEDEKRSRIAAIKAADDAAKKDDHDRAVQADKAMDAERARRVAEQKAAQQAVQVEEQAERVRRRSIASDMEDAEQKRRLEEIAREDAEAHKDDQTRAANIEVAVEMERKRQMTEMKGKIGHANPVAELVKSRSRELH